MRSRAPAALLIALVLGGEAAAAAAGPRTWVERAEKADALVRRGDYAAALEVSSRLVREMGEGLAAGENSDHALGTVLTVHALAEAGTGDVETAQWHWHLAQSFNPSLVDRSLTAYGEAGSLLDGHRLKPRDPDAVAELPEGCPSVDDVTAPKRLKAPKPIYPKLQRRGAAIGPVTLLAWIDTDGRARRPQVLDAPNPSLAYQAAEAVRRWRFEPSRCAGKPVTVYYRLTVNFTLGR